MLGNILEAVLVEIAGAPWGVMERGFYDDASLQLLSAILYTTLIDQVFQLDLLQVTGPGIYHLKPNVPE
jgi:hypothetical protein